MRIEGAGGGGGKQRSPVESENTLQSSAKAKILDLIAFGPIGGLVEGPRSVYLNDTPLENSDGSKNFEGINIKFLQGTPDQEVIPGFNSVENVVDVSTEVKYGLPITRTVSNPDADSAIVTIQLQSLNLSDTETGDLKPYQVEILLEWRVDGGVWNTGVSETISGKTMSPWQKSYRINFGGTSGVVDLRMTRVSVDDPDSSKQSKTYWANFTEVIERKFNYPDMALVGIEVDAKEFGNQMPKRTYDMYLSIISVPSNYDPVARTYTGIWDGTFKQAWTDNPAWAFYDLASHPIIGANVENVDKWALYKVAQHCDELVPDGFGGTEPRFTINTLFAAEEEAMSALATLASVFRGMVYWGSNTAVAVGDMPEDPVKLVTPANVIGGDFSYQGTALNERHSVAVVMYNDPENGYELTPVVYEDHESIRLYGWKQARVTAVGCSSKGQALRMAKWLLDSERTETEIVTYEASIDHADLKPGNIIKIADPYRAGARLGGRVITTGLTSLVLDQVPDETSTGTWYISVVLPNGTIEKREITLFTGNQVDLAATLSDTPVVGAMWVLSSLSVELPEYRVVSVEESSGKYKVTATEYDKGKYARVEQNLLLPSTPETLIPTGPIVAPQQINVVSTKYRAGGSEHQKITISWPPSSDARVIGYTLEVKPPGSFSFRTAYTGPSLLHEELDIEPGTWEFRVKADNGLGQSSQWVTLTTAIASELMPAAPTSVDLRIAVFSIGLTPVSPNSGANYEFWRSNVALAFNQIESNGTYLSTGPNMVDTGLEAATTYYYYVRGKNIYGVSDWFAVQGTTDSTPSALLTALSNRISDSHLATSLGDRIDLIDAPGTGLVDSLLAEIQARQTGDGDLQSAIQNIAAADVQFSDAAPTTKSNGNPLTDGDRWYDTDHPDGANHPYVWSSGAWADAQDGAIIANANSISNVATAIGLSGATSTKINALEAAAIDPFTGGGGLAAVISSQDVRARLDDVGGSGDSLEVVASNTEQVYAEVFDGTTGLKAVVETQSTAIAGVEASYTLKTDVNGHLAGWGLASTVNEYSGVVHSTMVFAVDTFGVGAPGATTLSFVIENNVVVMDGASIKDATITNAKIGSYVQSSNWVADTSGWRIDKTGWAEFNGIKVRGLEVRDDLGNLLLASGSSIFEWDNINWNGNAPESGATVGADWSTNITNLPPNLLQTEQVSESGRVATMAPRVAMRNATYTWFAWEDGTRIYRNGSLIATANAYETGDQYLDAGDVVESNQPIALNYVHSEAASIACLGQRFATKFYRPGNNFMVFQFYSPFGEANVELFTGTTPNWTTPSYTQTVPQGVVTRLEINETDGTEVRIVSDSPILIETSTSSVTNSGSTAGSDVMFLSPVSHHVIIGRSATVTKFYTTGSVENVNNSNWYYRSVDDLISLGGTADGAGSDGEQGLPLNWLCDRYTVLGAGVNDYSIVALEDGKVDVYYASTGFLYTSHNITGASSDTPVKIDVGVQSGATSEPALDSVGLVFKGSMRFALRSNYSDERESMVYGWDTKYRSQIGLNGSVVSDFYNSKLDTVESGATVGADWTTNLSGLPVGSLTRLALGTMHSGGFGDLRFQKNADANGATNPGEIRVQGSTFYHPDGTKRTHNGDDLVLTPFEGALVGDPFFIIWSDENPATRFSGGFNSEHLNFFPATYDYVTDTWTAIDNVQVTQTFTPLQTDCIVAIGRKWSTSGGIDHLSSLLGANIDLPEDGATVGADGTNLKVGLGVNQLYNSDFAQDFEGWGYWDQSGGDPDFTHNLNWGTDWTLAHAIAKTAYIRQNSGPEDNFVYDVSRNLGEVACSEGDRIEAFAYTGALRCRVDVLVGFYDDANVLVQTVTVGSNDSESGGGVKLSSYKKTGGFATAPANTYSARFILRKQATDTGQTNSYAFFTMCYMGYAGVAQTELSPWSDGVPKGSMSLKDSADWGVDVTGSGKPEDNATKGATWGVDIDGDGLPESFATVNGLSSLNPDPSFTKSYELSVAGINGWWNAQDHAGSVYFSANLGFNSTPCMVVEPHGTPGTNRAVLMQEPNTSNDWVIPARKGMRLYGQGRSYTTSDFNYTARCRIEIQERDENGSSLGGWNDIAYIDTSTRDAWVELLQGMSAQQPWAEVLNDNTRYVNVRFVIVSGSTTGHIRLDDFHFWAVNGSLGLLDQIDYTDDGKLIGKPATLGDINSGEGTKLSGIADGADVTTEQLAGSGVNIMPPRYSGFEANNYNVGTEFTTGGAGYSALEVYNGSAFFGTRSLRIQNNGADEGYVILSSASNDYNIPITPNKKWILSAYVRNSDVSSAQVQLYIKTATAWSPPGTKYTSATIGDWTRVSVVIDLTADNNTECLVRIDNDSSVQSSTPSWLYIDGVMLEEQIGDQIYPSAYALPYDFRKDYTGDLNANLVTDTNQITDGANLGKKADWSQVYDDGAKPEDNATWGANGSNLQTGVGVNLIHNSDFSSGLAGWWSWHNHVNTTPTFAVNLNDDWRPVYGNAAYIYQDDEESGVVADLSYPQEIPCYTGQKIEASGYLAAHRCNLAIYLKFSDVNGTQIGNWELAGSVDDADPQGGKDLSNYTRVGSIITAPANATTAKIIIRKFATDAGGGNSYAFFTMLYVGYAGAAQTELSPWSDGAPKAATTPDNPITSGNISTYIADLAVDTLQLAGQAVNIPSHAVAPSYSVTASWGTAVSVTFTSSGAPVKIVVGAQLKTRGFYDPFSGTVSQGSVDARVRVTQGAVTTTVETVTNFAFTEADGILGGAFSFATKHTPSPGSVTYKFQLKGISPEPATVISIDTLETKK